MDEQTNTIIGLIIALLIGAASWLAMAQKERQLDDPDDDSVVYLEQLIATSTLQHGGKYLVRIFRQSGNPQKDDQVFDSCDEAIKAATSTFKRAKIEYVVIEKNTEVEFIFRRPFHDHRGRAEGKKVGNAEIFKIA